MHESPNDPIAIPTDLSSAELGALTLASLDHLQEGISIVDKDLLLRVWNRRFIELLDFPPGLMRNGLPFIELMRYNARRGEYGPGDALATGCRTICKLAKSLYPGVRSNLYLFGN